MAVAPQQIRPPDQARPGYEWKCNACTFKTAITREAEDHAIEETARWPFAHILYERERGQPDSPAKLRIHSPDGRSVRYMEKPGRNMHSGSRRKGTGKAKGGRR